MIDKSPEKIRAMFAAIAPRYDRVNRVMSFRFDVRWRRHVAKHLLSAPGRVLDVAAGTGDLAVELRRRGHGVVASDFTFEMLAASHRGLRQVAGDALALPFRSNSFDGVTVGWGVRNFADPNAGLREIRRVLRPTGILGVLDVSSPARPLRPLFQLYFNRLMPAIGGLLSGQPQAYRYLRNSVHEFPEGSEFAAMMNAAGFHQVTIHRLTAGAASFYRGVRD